MSATMQVESFECVETASEPIEACEEAVGIMEELGLDGQLETVSETKEGNKQRCPYREITKEEQFVYQMICPEQTAIEKYKATPIPLRVLQIAAHAKKVIPDCHLVVWDKTKHEVKDPVLVAEIGERYSIKARYILARWGEVLETFSTLMKQALEVKRANMIAECKRGIAKAENASQAKLMDMNVSIY